MPSSMCNATDQAFSPQQTSQSSHPLTKPHSGNYGLLPAPELVPDVNPVTVKGGFLIISCYKTHSLACSDVVQVLLDVEILPVVPDRHPFLIRCHVEILQHPPDAVGFFNVVMMPGFHNCRSGVMLGGKKTMTFSHQSFIFCGCPGALSRRRILFARFFAMQLLVKGDIISNVVIKKEMPEPRHSC